ncbi:MAG: methylated-DNA--[protein]-cysteine S-methyltransferase [Acidimicrobiales bacterium]
MTTLTQASTWMTTLDSPIGTLTLAARDGRITGLHMDGADHAPTGLETWRRDDSQFKEAVRQVRAYFAGELTDFDLPLELEGTDFQRRVWQALQGIPYGQTISYGELARRVGNVKACRAVGLANGRNPVAVIVPCHRVIGANGTLTGFGGGLDRKKWLLDHERSLLHREGGR